MKGKFHSPTLQTSADKKVSATTKGASTAPSLSFTRKPVHPTIPVSTSDVAGHTFVGSFKVPLLGEQVFSFDFSDSNDQNTVRICGHGAVENGEGVHQYTLDGETGLISLYPVDTTETKKTKKKNQLERIIYNKAEDAVVLVFRIPMIKREGYIYLHREK